MLNNSRIAVLGAGKMGETLTSSLLKAGVVNKEQIIVSDIHEGRLKYIAEKYGVQTTTKNTKACGEADIVLLCVKPQVCREVLEGLKDTMTPDHLVISIIASVTSKFIEDILINKIPVVRAMPNTPCLIGKGMTSLCNGAYANDKHVDLAENIFKQVGRTLRMEEKHFDAITGLSASGPAFIYVVIESMAEGGVKLGLPRNIATELAAQACLGASSMVLETQNHPALLKDAVTTPAGCTIDGLMELEEGGLRVTLIKTIVRAKERASELIESS